jgi:hypothetical protein
VDVGDRDVSGVEVPVSAAVMLTGRVRVEPAQTLDFSKVVISLESLDSVNFMGGQATQAKSDGAFVLDSVAGGNYRLKVAGFPEQYYVKSARLGGGDVLEGGLTMTSSGALDIVLSPSGGSISGAVLKDHQPAQAIVVLAPDPPHRDRRDLYSSKLTKPDGTFTLVGLPPGDFKLFALESPDVDLDDPSSLQPYETKGLSVHNEDGKSQSVELELIPADDQP